MGTDINGAFGHRIPLSATVPLEESIRTGLQKISAPCSIDWWWAPDNYASSRLIQVGHGECSLYFGPRAAIISTGYSWPGPMDRPDKREHIISAMRAVARCFRSPRLILLPDDIEPWFHADRWIADGLTLDELQQRLAQIKEPSPDLLAAIRRGSKSCELDGCVIEVYEVDGYVIEELTYEAG